MVLYMLLPVSESAILHHNAIQNYKTEFEGGIKIASKVPHAKLNLEIMTENH